MSPQARREQLLDATLDVIARRGYDGLSIEAISRAAGVTRPVIYDHFSNLGRLLGALIEREESYALGQLAAVVPDQADPAELFAGAVRRFLDSVATRPETWRIILLPPEGTPAIVREHVRRSRAAVLSRIEALVSWAVESSGASTDVDVELWARGLWSLGEEAGRMVLADSSRYSPARYERFAREVIGAIFSSPDRDVP